ncbi:MAG: bifunctional diaminohydroxyphosphoribosylaminopyrimidine deaminase/5-amino-6-(5-phosphoribosylamino)uracil reductase RibD, partial [Pseudomonadota bacterium]
MTLISALRPAGSFHPGFADLALRVAAHGLGTTAPNPSVGAVLVRGETLLATGVTQPGGRPHAEIVALSRAAARWGPDAARGASMYVTLEPCCHQGRSGPCSKALLKAGVAQVFVGTPDPNPAVAGGGINELRAAGVHVHVQHDPRARWLTAGHGLVCLTARPFVQAKIAVAADGLIPVGT